MPNIAVFIEQRDGDLKKVRRRSTAPVKDHEILGRALAALGKSRLSRDRKSVV